MSLLSSSIDGATMADMEKRGSRVSLEPSNGRYGAGGCFYACVFIFKWQHPWLPHQTPLPCKDWTWRLMRVRTWYCFNIDGSSILLNNISLWSPKWANSVFYFSLLATVGNISILESGMRVGLGLVWHQAQKRTLEEPDICVVQVGVTTLIITIMPVFF